MPIGKAGVPCPSSPENWAKPALGTNPGVSVYDVEARHLFVESDVEKMQFSIDAFMAQHRGAEAQDALVWLFLDMFPNTPEDKDD